MKNSAKQFWSNGFGARLYRRTAASFYFPMHEQTAAMVTVRKPQNLLDTACGGGDFLLYLSGIAPQIQITGSDAAPGMIEAAKNKLGNKVTIVEASADTQPFPPESFDVITVMMAFHHFPGSAETLQNFRTLLRPGGALIIADVVARSSWQKHLWDILERITLVRGFIGHYTENELRSWAKKAGFKFSSSPIATMARRYRVNILEL